MRISTWLVTAMAGLALSPVQGTAVPAGTAGILDTWVSRIEQLVVPAAEAMPADRYAFAPTAGAFAGVRTFAEQVKHLAAANWQLGSRVLGEDPPAGTRDESAPETLRTKAQIVEYLKGSFACLHRAALLAGTGETTELGLIIDALAHASNHYGQMVVSLRMNGIVPPASR